MCTVFTILSPLFLKLKHCHPWPASIDKFLLVDSPPKTKSQYADLAWMDVECDKSYSVERHTSLH
jgi:hypothetical protein